MLRWRAGGIGRDQILPSGNTFDRAKSNNKTIFSTYLIPFMCRACAILLYIMCIVLFCHCSISWMALSVGIPSGCSGITM